MPQPSSLDARREAAPGNLLSVVALGVAVLLLGFVLWSRGDLAFMRSAAEPRPVVARGDLAEDERTTIEIFERASKSVVFVSPIRTVRTSPFQSVSMEAGKGTGFVWDTDGHIVTNYHVIQNSNRWQVTLADQTIYDAELVGVAPHKDLAVLHIAAPPHKLHPLAIGTSHDLRVGQKVLAIGNPFGLDQTLTTGVVSALNRTIRSPIDYRIEGVIQTDAAINPGNSGGPLLDSAGRLIGVNTMIVTETGGSTGIGFAVPVDEVNEAVPDLITHGEVRRPGLGVMLDDVLPRRMGLQCVHIVEVVDGSAAADAGLRGVRRTQAGQYRGDIILEIDGTPVRNRLDVIDVLGSRSVGDVVDLTVDRDGRELSFRVALQGLQSG